ncbi:hypothetical protein KUTeg_024116 [Tegillarca granosa]|uniref:Uncharacterized protein n=1 Tax=Tegillarca granosa TaxID=220873 RepID=A0ABQ9E237_TEGGR|nr:hypothetical protein KUTeg_024116 [Tegillarca granosa]
MIRREQENSPRYPDASKTEKCSNFVGNNWFLQDNDESYEKLLEKRFAQLQEKLQHAEFVSQQRENDLHVMHSQFNHVVQMLAQNNISNRMATPYGSSDVISEYQSLSNLSQTSLHLPSLFTYLPHIIGKPESLKPKYTLSKNKFSEGNRQPLNYDYVTVIGKEIHQGMRTAAHVFLDQQSSGLGSIWRTKQNLDFSFLMLYARNRGAYYVQLEDDVISKPGYFSIMKTYAERQTGDDWILLEFSTLGFIGTTILMLHRAHVNPPAELKTSLKAYQKFKIQKAYIGEDIFWATSPVKGDFILITFTPPIELDGFLIRSGNTDHPSDKFYNSVADILPSTPLDKEYSSLFNKTDNGFYSVTDFDKNGLANVSLKEPIGKINSIRIRVLATSDFWVLISECFGRWIN